MARLFQEIIFKAFADLKQSIKASFNFKAWVRNLTTDVKSVQGKNYNTL